MREREKSTCERESCEEGLRIGKMIRGGGVIIVRVIIHVWP